MTLGSMASDGSARSRSFSGRLQRVMPIQFFAQWLERSQGEDGFNRHVEELADPHGQLEAGGVICALEKSHRLVVDAERVGQLVARAAAVSAEDSQPIVDARRGLGGLSPKACHAK